MRETVRTTKWVAGGIEALLGIPLLGGSIVLAMTWTPLIAMLAFHIVNLVLSSREGLPITGSIIGIIGNALGWIPGLGMVMHILTAIFVMMEAYKTDVDKPDEAKKVEDKTKE